MAIDTQQELEVLRQQLAEMTERVTRLATINQIARLITSRLSLKAVFQTAVAAIHADLRFAYVAAGLVDPERPDMLVLYAQAGSYAAQIPDDYRQSIEIGLVGRAARTRAPVLVNDVSSDPHYVQMPGADTIHAELAVPIMLETQLLGVLNIEADREITPDDVEGICVVAEQLGIAIGSVRRYDAEHQRRERMALIARIGQRIAARLDPETLFTTTTDELREQMAYDHVSLFLVDEGDPGLLVQHAHSSRWPRPNEIGYQQSIEVGILGRAARTREPVLHNDVAADPAYVPIPGAPAGLAELALPIVLGDRLLGVLDVAGTRRMGAEDIANLQMIADQLAVAVDNARLFATAQRSLDELHLLYSTSQRLGSALDVDDVVAGYLREIAVRGRYVCSIVLYDLDAAGRPTAVVVRGRWSRRDGVTILAQRLPHSQDALDAPLDAGETITIRDVHSDPRVSPELRAIQEAAGRPALAMIPLIARGQRIGLVILSHTQRHDWPLHDLRIYQVTAAQLATAIDTRQQQQLLGERSRQLAVFEDRRRLARDLHDSVTQLIFSMTLIAQSIGPAWERSRDEGQGRIDRLLDLSRMALREMRALLVELQPPEDVAEPSLAAPAVAEVRRHGLVEALRQHIAGIGQDGLAVTLDATRYTAQRRVVEDALFRITQEALYNVVKHAGARHATITLGVRGRAVHLQICDDGRGTQPAPATATPGSGGGFGLRSMRERAEAIGGVFTIRRRRGGGTTVAVRAPRQDEEQA